MKSKLLQKKINQSREAVDDQRDNIEDSSAPWRGRENRPDRVTPPLHARARNDFPGHLRRDCRRQHRLP
jgi:hypothetical protein